MKKLSIEEKAKRYDEAIKKAKSKIKNDKDHIIYEDDVIEIFPELKDSEDEQNILFEELKDIHLRMEHQTVCNDAGGNKMWSRAWRLVNEAINVIKEDKETFKW